MIKLLKKGLKRVLRISRTLRKINWLKTIYFNFKMLPYKQAKKLPLVFYGKVKFSGLNGQVVINAPPRFGMVGFGQQYELISVSKKNAQLILNGTFIINGHIQFGIDYFLYVASNAILEMGHLASLGGSGKIICTNKIVFGKYARIGFESQVIDTNFHQMYDTKKQLFSNISEPIILGEYNFIGNRVSIMKATRTPNYCNVASNSVLTKDYSQFGINILIGGIPSKLLKENIKRDWENENLENFLIVKL